MLDKLRYKKIKLAKCREKRRRKQDNVMFQLDQKGFFRTLEGEQAHEGEMLVKKLFGTNNGGIEGQYWRTVKQSWCGTSSSTYEKPLLPKDQT